MERKDPSSGGNLYSFIAVAKALKKIVKGQSVESYSDPQSLLKLLKDELHSDYPREASLIVTPLNANILDVLKHIKNNKKLEQKLSPTINKISSQFGYEVNDASRAVYSWAYALDKITESDYKEILKLEPHSNPQLDRGASAPAGIRFDKEIRTTRESRTSTPLSSAFRNNKFRIPIAVGVAILAIGIIYLNSGSRDMHQQTNVQTYSIQIQPSSLVAGNNATVSISPSPDSDSSMSEFILSYKVINGTETEPKILRSASGGEFQTPLSDKKYSILVELLGKDENGSYSKVAEKAIMAEPTTIRIVLE
jgi:hypothetical protein